VQRFPHPVEQVLPQAGCNGGFIRGDPPHLAERGLVIFPALPDYASVIKFRYVHSFVNRAAFGQVAQSILYFGGY
jgi:hypothetical protein